MIRGRTVSELIEIAAAGGGLDLRAPGKSVLELIQIAAAASRSGARVIISPVGKSTAELVQIAAAGKGCVLFQGPPEGA